MSIKKEIKPFDQEKEIRLMRLKLNELEREVRIMRTQIASLNKANGLTGQPIRDFIIDTRPGGFVGHPVPLEEVRRLIDQTKKPRITKVDEVYQAIKKWQLNAVRTLGLGGDQLARIFRDEMDYAKLCVPLVLLRGRPGEDGLIRGDHHALTSALVYLKDNNAIVEYGHRGREGFRYGLPPSHLLHELDKT